MARGRKSAASLETVPVEEVRNLPPPPAELTDFEAALWQTTVATKPADWFTADSHQILIAYCRHCSQAAVIDQQITEYEPAWLKTDEGLARYQVLTNMREKQSRIIASLATKMRLTQQARYEARTAGRAAAPKSGKRPWEN